MAEGSGFARAWASNLSRKVELGQVRADAADEAPTLCRQRVGLDHQRYRLEVVRQRAPGDQASQQLGLPRCTRSSAGIVIVHCHEHFR